MALKFSAVCDLLQNLENIHRHDPPFLSPDRNTRQTTTIDSWFKSHRRAVDALDHAGAVALLSSLLPERRTDRVYGLQSASLANSLCRSLGLSAVKSKDLRSYTIVGHGDLADCLQRVLDGGGPPALPPVTIGEVDSVMIELASRCRFSSPSIQSLQSPRDPLASMANLIKRSHPVEAKWLARIVLKDLTAIHLDDSKVLRSIHFLLPDIMRYQQDFDAAIETLKGFFGTQPSNPDQQSATLVRELVSGSFRPKTGIKVSRSTFCKARSIDHCLQVANKKHWMLERKYDGEYCEIHIDLSRGNNWLKIFSKSGKDSTQDREELRDVLKRSLAVGRPDCRLKNQCIILGEMLVYSATEKQIMPFHKIRSHVSRSGSYIGISEETPASPDEHLMIVYFDLLLLDDVNMIQKCAEERKSALIQLVRTKVGKAVVAESKVLDLAEPDAKRKLMMQMAASIAARHEGIILKPCGRPYLSSPVPGERDTSTFIKLKKDYIDGLGDEADLAVIGASYDPQVALARGVGPRDYTHFHLACLVNSEEDVYRYGVKPCFKVVATVSCDGCIPPVVLPEANRLARLYQEECDAGISPGAFDMLPETPRMDVVLREPIVFEVLGSSYEKPSGCNYWMLRHPRVKKLHQDRTWKDCVSFVDLQKMANMALAAPPDSESQENLRWMDRIEKSCRRKHARASAQTTPESKCSTSQRRRGFTESISPCKAQRSAAGKTGDNNDNVVAHGKTINAPNDLHHDSQGVKQSQNALQPLSVNVGRVKAAGSESAARKASTDSLNSLPQIPRIVLQPSATMTIAPKQNKRRISLNIAGSATIVTGVPESSASSAYEPAFKRARTEASVYMEDIDNLPVVQQTRSGYTASSDSANTPAVPMNEVLGYDELAYKGAHNVAHIREDHVPRRTIIAPVKLGGTVSPESLDCAAVPMSDVPGSRLPPGQQDRKGASSAPLMYKTHGLVEPNGSLVPAERFELNALGPLVVAGEEFVAESANIARTNIITWLDTWLLGAHPWCKAYEHTMDASFATLWSCIHDHSSTERSKMHQKLRRRLQRNTEHNLLCIARLDTAFNALPAFLDGKSDHADYCLRGQCGFLMFSPGQNTVNRCPLSTAVVFIEDNQDLVTIAHAERHGAKAVFDLDELEHIFIADEADAEQAAQERVEYDRHLEVPDSQDAEQTFQQTITRTPFPDVKVWHMSKHSPRLIQQAVQKLAGSKVTGQVFIANVVAMTQSCQNLDEELEASKAQVLQQRMWRAAVYAVIDCSTHTVIS